MTNALRVTRGQALLWLAVGLIAGLVLANAFGAIGNAKADEHRTGVEALRSNVVEANFVPGQSRSSTEVWFRGSGFTPGAEIALLIADSNGVLTDITVPAEQRRDGGGSVYPLIVNDDGAFATNWRIGRFTREAVGAEGMFTVWAVDGSDFSIVASTPLALCNLTNRAEGTPVPTYCSK